MTNYINVAFGLLAIHDHTMDFIFYYNMIISILKVVETHNIFVNIKILTKSYYHLKHAYNIKIFVY